MSDTPRRARIEAEMLVIVRALGELASTRRVRADVRARDRLQERPVPVLAVRVVGERLRHSNVAAPEFRERISDGLVELADALIDVELRLELTAREGGPGFINAVGHAPEP